jgi:transposase
MTEMLFPELPTMSPAAPTGAECAAPRLRLAVRDQVELRMAALDDLLEPEHEVRAVWAYAGTLDLSSLRGAIGSVEGEAGHPAADPRVLASLWLYATLRGVGSARELDRLCRHHVAYQWLCGGVSVNYHTLSDFRVAHGELLDRILTESVAVLLHAKVVTMDRVAQDGMKVRASAGASSFRRERTLVEHLADAGEQVRALRAELEEDPGASTRRQRAARERAARERRERLERATAELEKVRAARKPAEREKARASTTDPEARVMKMGDGGYRPAYNAQLATDAATQVIVGVAVTNSGGDQGQMLPMVEQIEARHGRSPAAMLADGGYVKKEDIEALSGPAHEVRVYAPPMAPKKADQDPHAPRADDGPGVAAWRARMGTEEAKAIYKERAATAECVNAQARNRGLYAVRVRGRRKVLAVVLWYVLAHNLRRMLALGLLPGAGAGEL